MVRKLAYSVSDREHWISAVGGLAGMLAVFGVSYELLGSHASILAVASMGASAVLLFAVPHGPLSQPWPVFGGHMISALCGVIAAQLIAPPILAASVAVAAAIGFMYWLRCIHPPGGATALFAVMGGPGIVGLGFNYLFVPVLLNVVVLLIVAVVFNYPFTWRRYPQAWWRESVEAGIRLDPVSGATEKCMIPHSDLVYALSQLDTFIDVSEEDLQRIYALALGHPQVHEAASSTQAANLQAVSQPN